MKPLPLFLCGIMACLSVPTAFAHAAPVPNRWGVYIVDVVNDNCRSMGSFDDWQLSPNGQFLVGGTNRGTTHPLYEVSIIATAGGKTRRLEHFPVEAEATAAFHWSPDSASVRVEIDRNDDGESETKTFAVGRASHTVNPKARTRSLSPLALKRIKARYPHITDTTFSPDGKRVAAYLSRSSYEKSTFDGGLWVFTPDGKNLKRITRNRPLPKHDFLDVRPHWLPDGRRLAFQRLPFEAEI